jgi:hypothetical protein
MDRPRGASVWLEGRNNFIFVFDWNWRDGSRMRWTSVLTLLGVGPGCRPVKDVWFIRQLLETEDGHEKSPKNYLHGTQQNRRNENIIFTVHISKTFTRSVSSSVDSPLQSTESIFGRFIDNMVEVLLIMSSCYVRLTFSLT